MVILTAYGGEPVKYSKVVKSQNPDGLGRLECYQGDIIVATYDGISDFSGYILTNEDGTPAEYSEPEIGTLDQLKQQVSNLSVMFGLMDAALNQAIQEGETI